jgi:hypothetical protein
LHSSLIETWWLGILDLFKNAYNGKLQAHFANIPIESIKLFDNKFFARAKKFDREEVELSICIQEEYILNEDEIFLWVYPKNGDFILSDDYFSYEAFRRLEFDFLPCIVLGEPEAPGVEDIQGPIALGDLRASILVSVKESQ